MRWHIGKLKAELWHLWFAWHPVTVGNQRVWLEMVWRREVHIPCHPCGLFDWEYRL